MRARHLLPTALVAVAATGANGLSRLWLSDDFSGAAVDQRRWRITRQGDFQESTVDVVNGRLRMRMATIGTRDDTVKFHGVRSAQAFDISQGVAVSFELDWNEQANGSYLTAGMYLCPAAIDGNPRDQESWLKLEYIGVPPGKNARALLATRQGGHLRHIYTEGWPDEQRTGRKIGRVRARLVVDGPLVQVWENGKLLFEAEQQPLPFEQAYLYLQMSSHSNYPARELFFDDVRVAALGR